MSVTAARAPRVDLVRGRTDLPSQSRRIPQVLADPSRSPDAPASSSAPGREPRPLRLRATSRGRLLVVLLAVGVLVAVALGGARALAGPSGAMSPVAVQRVTVLPGQTLWSVAAATQPSGDIRDRVAEIRQLNKLESSGLDAGQQLLVPLS